MSVDTDLLEAAGVDHVPESLAARDRWMVWKYKDNGSDKPRKVPRAPWDRPLRYGASSQDPALWVNLQTALEHAADNDEVDGIAYVLANADPEHENADDLPEPDHVLIDFDNVRNPDTGALHFTVERLLEDADTYAQVSTSGTGYHFVGRARLPDDVKSIEHDLTPHKEFDEASVEVYDNGRYIAFTGSHVEGSPDDTHDVQELIDDIVSAADTEQSTSSTEPREPKKSRDELADVDTTHDMDDVLDAIDQVRPSDIRLRSEVTADRADGSKDIDPSWAKSESGTRLAQLDDGWIYRKGMVALDAVQVVALEERIITSETEYPSGEDWWNTVEELRDRGAHIPEYVPSDLPEERVKERGQLTDQDEWEIWSEAREAGELTQKNSIPDGALRHLAKEYNLYDFDALPEDVDELPAAAHNRALGWVQNTWAEDIGLDEDEAATARPYQNRTESPVFTWQDVRYAYEASSEEGRLAAVKLLREKREFLTPQDTEELHIYDPDLGIFDKTAKYLIGRELDRELGSNYSQHEKREIMGRLKEVTVEREDLDARRFGTNYVCVKNGVLDVDNSDLLEHDPKYKFTTYLPIEYDQDAVPENTLRFLRDITKRNEDVLTLLEVLGHTLVTDYDDVWKHLFMIIFGEGSNGKSTWYNVVRTFLNGPQKESRNVENLSLQRITENQFATSNLVGAWANIGEDLPQKKIGDPGQLKELTGGGEMVAEPKGKQLFNYTPRATMMFAANRPPILEEQTNAVKRRLVPIHLPYEFVHEPDPDDPYQKKAQPGLIDGLTTEEELSGLLNEALAGLARLRENGDVSLPESYDERMELYERHSDHIKAFRVDCLSNEAGYEVPKDDVYNAYTNYCEENDYAKVSNSVFWRQIRQTTLNVSEYRPPENPDGNRPRVLQRTRFKEDGLMYAPEGYEDEASEDEAEGEDDPERAGFGDIVALNDLSPADGWTTITVEAVSVSNEEHTESGPVLSGTLRDSTDMVDFVDFFGVPELDELEEGGYYRISGARLEVSDRYGPQLKFHEKVSEVDEIQQGVGHTPPADPGGSERLDSGAAADGGTTVSESESLPQADVVPKALLYVRKHTKGTDGVPHAEVVEHLVDEGVTKSRAEGVIKNLLSKGEIHEPASGRYKAT